MKVTAGDARRNRHGIGLQDDGTIALQAEAITEAVERICPGKQVIDLPARQQLLIFSMAVAIQVIGQASRSYAPSVN